MASNNSGLPQSIAAGSRVFFTPANSVVGKVRHPAFGRVARRSAREALQTKVAAGRRQARLKAACATCRTPREFSWRESTSVTDVPATLVFSAKSVSERAKLRSAKVVLHRAPYNPPLERTPPRCALWRRSTKGYTAQGHYPSQSMNILVLLLRPGASMASTVPATWRGLAS